MSRPAVPLSLLVSAVALLWAPVALALGILVAAGELAGGPAFLAGAALAAILALIVRPYLADILAVRAYVEELGHRDQGTPPHFVFQSAPAELCDMITRMHAAWRRSRDELRAAGAASTAVLDHVPDPLLQLDENRQIVRGNRAARALFGPNLEGRDLSAVLRIPDLLAAADSVLAGRDEVAIEFSLPVPIERAFLAGIFRLPAPTTDGTVAIVRLHDLTEIKRTEQMRADFVANVSHELKTPLTTLIGYIETLRGPARGDPEATDRLLAVMAQQAARMNRLVEDLLSLSRIEMHEHRAPTERVDLAEILRAVASLLQVKAAARGQKIALELPPELPLVIGDASELNQVFENLVDNAVRYGAEGTTIRITAERVPGPRGEADRVAVAVRDRGPGIAKEHLPRLTERFYRVDAARSRELGGTGLGLAIVKHIVNRHRGELRIESELGKGSTFTVILPAANGRTAQARAAAQP